MNFHRILNVRRLHSQSQVDLYKTLGVDPSASNQAIKAQFYKLSKQFHPDVNPSHAAHYTDISNAYNILSDPKSRTEYDASHGHTPIPHGHAPHRHAPSQHHGTHHPHTSYNHHSMGRNSRSGFAWKPPSDHLDPSNRPKSARSQVYESLKQGGRVGFGSEGPSGSTSSRNTRERYGLEEERHKAYRARYEAVGRRNAPPPPVLDVEERDPVTGMGHYFHLSAIIGLVIILALTLNSANALEEDEEAELDQR